MVEHVQVEVESAYESADGARIEVTSDEGGFNAGYLGQRPVLAVGRAHDTDDCAGFDFCVRILLGCFAEMPVTEFEALGVQRHNLIGRNGSFDDLGIGLSDDGCNHEGRGSCLGERLADVFRTLVSGAEVNIGFRAAIAVPAVV